LNKCPKCNYSRYKPKADKIECTKGVLVKVIWYLPILPRFRRLFSNPKDAELMQWHVKCRKDDGMLRHPADSPQWRNIDIIHSKFASDPRNLRLDLCTVGMNPYGNMSSRHSTWPVLLCVYNLPRLCMRRCMLMSLLILGPRQPGNDIDVFLAHLLHELKQLWEEGHRVWDAHKR
jgi:Transposase family tnp2